MIRCCLMLTCLTIALMSIGCCGPMACGTGCQAPIGCNDCDCIGSDYPVMRPFDRVRNFNRNLMCGSGCGERYVGEWTSTPPDCQDPCCGTQWGGGAAPCRPFCWEPGALFGRLYGSRFCDGAVSGEPCGCEGECDGGCGAGGIVDHGGTTAGDCGCASCNQGGAVVSRLRTAQRAPAVDSMTRSGRQMDARGDFLVR